jgi:hypothetical protein
VGRGQGHKAGWAGAGTYAESVAICQDNGHEARGMRY